jgi:hypothetical protein
LITFAFVSSLNAHGSAPIVANTAADLGGVHSIYTEPLFELLSTIVKAPTDGSVTTQPIRLQAWETPGNELYIGLEQRMSIDAPLSEVQAVIDDINHYKDLFPGYKDVHIVSQDRNQIVTYWEQVIPLFFVPNAKYEMIYSVDSGESGRRVYRYQLKKASVLKASDGFVLISKNGENKTSYVEYDFFDAEWGAAKIMGRDKIWTDAVEGIALSDLAIKLKSENTGWSHEKARSESARLLQKSWVETAIKSAKPFVIKSTP